jgi:hypothetical protein
MQSDDVITPIEAALIIGIKTQTLAMWRCYQAVSLPFYRAVDGKRIFYKESEVRAFAENRKQKLAK